MFFDKTCSLNVHLKPVDGITFNFSCNLLFSHVSTAVRMWLNLFFGRESLQR